jgi:hypothetical protein
MRSIGRTQKNPTKKYVRELPRKKQDGIDIELPVHVRLVKKLGMTAEIGV